MIKPAKRKLNTQFIKAWTVASLIFLTVVYLFLHYGAINSAKHHMTEGFEVEFLHLYHGSEMGTLGKIVEDERFQALDRNGKTVIEVHSRVKFNPPLNRDLLNAAFSGRTGFEILNDRGKSYVIGYFPLDEDNVARVTGDMDEYAFIKGGFLKIMVIIIPFLLVAGYIFNRYMVHQALKPIESVMKYQETFSSNITHELNSPLTAIKGNLEVTLKKERSESEYREAIKSSLKDINSIVDLLDNLYLLATSDFKPLDLYKENMNMALLINETIEKYEPLIFAKNLHLDISLPQNAPCMCDASLMRRVIENVIDNALKYSSSNGLIAISAINDKDKISLTISNTCEGISPDEPANFLKPFYRGKTAGSSRTRGRGLGLYIANYIVQSHGGRIFMRYDQGVLSLTLNIPAQ